jgi:hypothetical protein
MATIAFAPARRAPTSRRGTATTRRAPPRAATAHRGRVVGSATRVARVMTTGAMDDACARVVGVRDGEYDKSFLPRVVD